MKRLIPTLLLVTSIGLHAGAQVTDKKMTAADSIILIRNYINASDTAIENRLVELAMKSPSYDASNHELKINELELKRAKNAWLNLLTISTNYNDQSFAQQNTTLVYPKYFFGVTIPLGIIFSSGNQVKAARESVALRKDKQEELKRSIKADIIAKYRQYRLYASLLQVQNELINDVLAKAEQAEKDFKTGNITVEAYTSALKTKNEELTKNLTLKYQRDLIKISIEQVIGMPLEMVLVTPPATPAATPKK